MQNFKPKAAVFVISILLTACGKDETDENQFTPASIAEQTQSDPEIICIEDVINNAPVPIQAEQQTVSAHYSTETETDTETGRQSGSQTQELYQYEVKTRADGSSYAVITGLCEDYAELFQPMWEITFPEQLGGAVVTEFAPDAFQNIPLGDYSYGRRLKFSPDIVSIGAHCFENCGLTSVTFEKQDTSGTDSSDKLTIDERAFADNPELWGIYFSDRTVTLEKEVFAGCAETGYLCYETFHDTPSEMADSLKTYAEQTGWNTAEIPDYYNSEPIIDYPGTPLILTPEVGSFFYGESAEDDNQFCTFEHSDDAPDYGFPEWHIPAASSARWQ